MNTTQRLLFSGLAVAALLTAGWLGFQEPTNLASNDLSNDQITANTTQGLVRSQDVIDAKIRRKEMKLNGEKSDTPRNPSTRLSEIICFVVMRPDLRSTSRSVPPARKRAFGANRRNNSAASVSDAVS